MHEKKKEKTKEEIETLQSIVKKVEDTLKGKQNNGTCKTLNEEINLLCGAMVVMNELLGKNPEELDTAPVSWILNGMTGRSVTGFIYREDELQEVY